MRRGEQHGASPRSNVEHGCSQRNVCALDKAPAKMGEEWRPDAVVRSRGAVENADDLLFLVVGETHASSQTMKETTDVATATMPRIL